MGGSHGADLLDEIVTAFDPTIGSVGAVVTGFEFVIGLQFIIEDAAVIEHAGHEIDAELVGAIENRTHGPRFERIQNDHGPVDEVAVVFKALDEVEDEAVGRSGGDADFAGEPFLTEFVHGVPNVDAGVAMHVGIVEEEAIEVVSLAALQ